MSCFLRDLNEEKIYFRASSGRVLIIDISTTPEEKAKQDEMNRSASAVYIISLSHWGMHGVVEHTCCDHFEEISNYAYQAGLEIGEGFQFLKSFNRQSVMWTDLRGYGDEIGELAALVAPAKMLEHRP